MASAELALLDELVSLGLVRREARWIVEEFAPGGDPAARSAVLAAARRRLEGEPLQYVVGHWPFRSLDLDLDNRVLIPRPETEELVGVAITELARADAVTPRILDLGCGSGAIGLSILVELAERGVYATLMALDESEGALAVARRNAIKHRQVAVTFVRSSWFEGLDASLRGQFDLIVANPPYVGAGEFRELDEVLHYEPEGALVAADADGVEGFADIAEIVRGAPLWLRAHGSLVLEHGATQANASRSAALAAGFAHVETMSDMSGHDRILVARMSS